MRWQRAARLAIAAFVIVFAGVVVYVMRERSAAPAPAAPEVRPAPDCDAAVFNPDGVEYEETRDGKLRFRLRATSHVACADGRQELEGVELTLPDRDGRTVVIRADEARLTKPPEDGEIGRVTFDKNVRFTTDDGLDVRTASAVYDDSTGMLTIPGAVDFSRARMSGSGVGATYDRNRDVLWLLDEARINVAPDAAGQGAARATAGAAGLARAENYLRLTRDARIVSDDRTIEADDVFVQLRGADGEIERVELRGNSRITGTEPAGRTLSARDIDLFYAAEGQVVERALLVEHASVDLPAGEGSAGRRISARTIELTMAPDGNTVTSLSAHEQVLLNLPASGDAPARQIRAAELEASGPPEAGLTGAVFKGDAEFRETRGGAAPVDRTARAERLMLRTAAGLADIEQADFRGRFTFGDAAGTKAGAPRALYHVNRDRLELTPLAGEAGPTPFVDTGRFFVEAAGIQLSPATQELTADGDVRSTVQPSRGGGTPASAANGAADKQARMPALLEDDRPVRVAAAGLTYDGQAVAVYSGGSRLWQDGSGSKIDAETIEVDDTTGNLTARGNVRSAMVMEDTDPKTKQARTTLTTAAADQLVYEDAKRIAVYTGTAERRAQMQGVHGDVSADRIELFLDEDGRHLERADARGHVTVKEPGRVVDGNHLVYTAADDTYVMTGNPVTAVEREGPQTCRTTVGTTLTFQRAIGSISADAAGTVPVQSTTGKCPPGAPESRD